MLINFIINEGENKEKGVEGGLQKSIISKRVLPILKTITNWIRLDGRRKIKEKNVEFEETFSEKRIACKRETETLSLSLKNK